MSATPTIAPTPSATIVEGHVLDEDGMPLPGLVVRVTHRDGGTGFTTATDGLGHYEGELTPGGGEITVYIQGVAGTTWYATNGDAFVVETGVTTTFDPDVTTGYHLKVTNQTGNPAAVAPSGSYQLQLSYVAWNRTGAPQAHPFLGVGAAADTVTLHELGVPGVFGATSNSGSVTLTLNAPAGSPGQSVTIYAKPVIANTTAAGEADWADRFANAELYIPIGTLTFK